jgi:hypothetical protein
MMSRRLAALCAVTAFLTLASPLVLRAQGLLVFDEQFGVVKFDDFGLVAGVFAQPPAGSTLAPTWGMIFGPSGDLYVASTGNPRGCEVWRFDGKTGASKGILVSPPATGGKGCDVLAFGPDGNIYTTGVLIDVVQRFNGTTGAFMGNFVTPGPELFAGLNGIAFGPDENLYVGTTDSRVLRYDGQTGAFLDAFVAAGSGGLFSPGSLVFGPDGHLYVVSYHNCGSGLCAGGTSILRFNGRSGAFIDAFVTGSQSDIGDLTVVGGIAFGPDGNLYVTNFGSGRPGHPQAAVVRYNGKTGRFIDNYLALSPLNFAVLRNPRAIAFFPRLGLCPDGNISDSDGDGLLDCWERHGIDVDSDGVVDYKLEHDFNGNGVIDPVEKADPFHKDVFVEIDWMALHQPDAGALNAVVASFAASPVNNPDQTAGVRLHVLVDEESTPHVIDMTFADALHGTCGSYTALTGVPDFDQLKSSHFGTALERADSKAIAAKRMAYHYSMFLHGLWGAAGLSGCSELPGNDFVVSLGGWLPTVGVNTESNGSVDQQAATFMHELGHNLGLRHGGGDGVNCKPNYLSVMNYTFMYDGAFVNGRRLDYSYRKLLTLDKSNLDETQGILGGFGDRTAYGPPVLRNGYYYVNRSVDASGAIDWSGNGSATGTMVAEPGLNDLHMTGCRGDGQILVGHDDWSNLNYDFQHTEAFADGVRASPPEEIPIDELALASGDDDGDGIPTIVDNCPSVANADQADLNHNGIGDRCDPVNQPPTAQAGADQVVDATSPLGATVTLSGSATDPNGDPLTFTWSEGSSNIGSGNPTVATLPVGVHRITLNVADGRGGTASSLTQVTVRYSVCLLYDPNVAKKTGSTYPLKVRLCDTSGRSLSSPSVVLHATGVTKISSNTPAALDDSGNANPDFDFRYDAGSDVYMFNLSTRGYATGTYALSFTAGDGAVHSVVFAIK